MTTQWHDPLHGHTSRTAPQAVPTASGMTILGVPIAAITGEALAVIEQLHDAGRPAIVAFANAHTLNLAVDDPSYALLRTCDLLCNDGSGVALAARIQGCDFPENLNGTDLCPKVLELARSKGWRTFFLGGVQAWPTKRAGGLSSGCPDSTSWASATGTSPPTSSAR